MQKTKGKDKQRDEIQFRFLGKSCTDHGSESACEALSHFDLAFHRPVGVVCAVHKGVVPNTKLLCHLMAHVRDATSRSLRSSPKHLWPIVQHICSTFNLDPEVDIPLPDEIDEPIPFAGAPYLASQCPVCSSWLMCKTQTSKGSTTMVHHYKQKKHEGVPPLKPITRYIQRLALGAFDGSGFRPTAMLPMEWTPNDDSGHSEEFTLPALKIYRTLPAAPHGAEFLDEVGWPAYIKSLGKKCSLEHLKALVRLPTLAYADKIRGEKEKWLELGLCKIHELNEEYLKVSSFKYCTNCIIDRNQFRKLQPMSTIDIHLSVME